MVVVTVDLSQYPFGFFVRRYGRLLANEADDDVDVGGGRLIPVMVAAGVFISAATTFDEDVVLEVIAAVCSCCAIIGVAWLADGESSSCCCSCCGGLAAVAVVVAMTVLCILPCPRHTRGNLLPVLL